MSSSASVHHLIFDRNVGNHSKYFNGTTSHHLDDELFELTWNEILYDGGLATWIPRSSFRWLTITICLIGVLGNILAVSTLLRRRLRKLTTYTYLTALCLSNTVTLISVIMFEVDLLVAPNRFNCLAVSFAKALASSSFALSTWITICFTVDRYIMICYPFTGENKCTRRNAFYVLMFCLILSITYLIPQLLAQKCHPIVQNYYNQSENSTGEPSSSSNQSGLMWPIFWVSGLSDMGQSHSYRLTITLFVNCFLVRIIPCLIIFKLNFHLIQTLAQTRQRHRQINPYEERRNDLTYMLVIVISMYLICIVPSIPFAAFFAYDPHQYVDISFHFRIFQHLDEFAKFLMIFNSASQCFLYIFFGKRFRRELYRLVCCLCVKYFYMPVPDIYSQSDQETLNANLLPTNDVFELVVRGKWSLDQRQDSIAGLEFSLHYSRRASRLTASSRTTTTTRSDSIYSEDRINFALLKRLKNRFERFFSRFQ